MLSEAFDLIFLNYPGENWPLHSVDKIRGLDTLSSLKWLNKNLIIPIRLYGKKLNSNCQLTYILERVLSLDYIN
jgi:hypothetical protein